MGGKGTRWVEQVSKAVIAESTLRAFAFAFPAFPLEQSVCLSFLTYSSSSRHHDDTTRRHVFTLGRVTVRMCVSSSSLLITLFERLRVPAASDLPTCHGVRL